MGVMDAPVPSEREQAKMVAEWSWRHFYTNVCIDKKYLLNHKLQVVLPHSMESAVLQITTMVAGERVKEIAYPLDWWQAFKERWFPKIILKRWPVRYHRWKVDFLYPELEVRGGHPEIAIYDSQRSKGYPSWEDRPEELKEEE